MFSVTLCFIGFLSYHSAHVFSVSFSAFSRPFRLAHFSCSHSFTHSNNLNQVPLVSISKHRHLKINKTQTEITFFPNCTYWCTYLYKSHYRLLPPLHSSEYCFSPYHIWAHQLQWCSNGLSVSRVFPFIPSFTAWLDHLRHKFDHSFPWLKSFCALYILLTE